MITGLTALLVLAALVTTGLAFTSRAPTLKAQVLWWLFLAGLGALALGGAIVVAVKGRDYRLKTLAIGVPGRVRCERTLRRGAGSWRYTDSFTTSRFGHLGIQAGHYEHSDDNDEICGRPGGHIASGSVRAPRDREVVGHDKR